MCVPLPGERSEPGQHLRACCGVRPLAHVREWTSSHNTLSNAGPAGTFLFLKIGNPEIVQEQNKKINNPPPPLPPNEKKSFVAEWLCIKALFYK